MRKDTDEKEMLTLEIAEKYRKKALKLGNAQNQFVGEIRNLAKELQERCGATELEAINILNGNHIMEYVQKYGRKNSNLAIDEELHKKKISLLQQEEEAADRRAIEDNGW